MVLCVSNLSILECKFNLPDIVFNSINVSNLSILECKFFNVLYPNIFVSKFLIYPYWNVNDNIDFNQDTESKVSNLSILECKCCYFN